MKKKYFILIIALMFIILCINVFGQSKDYSFSVKKTGQGKRSLIFIPGFASSGDVWNETRAQFEKDYTCYTLNMAGFAGMQPQSDPTFKKWEAEIADFISKNKIEKPVIVGHSMGGGLALAIASDYPELAGSIIVVDALPCLAAIMNPSFKAKENNDCSESTKQIITMTEDQFYKMQKSSIPRLLEDTTKQEMVVGWSMKSDRKTFAEMYCDFSNTDLRAKIGNIKCPSLILLEAYFINMKPAMEEQYKTLKTATVKYADKGLHFIMYDDKDWYFAQVKSFLSAN